MQPTPESLRATLAAYPAATRYWLAYSGGLDSHVLLHLCSRLFSDALSETALQAVHVHHGLQSQADGWADHCQQTCQTLTVPCLTLHVDARATPGQSPEEAARRARYGAICTLMAPGDVLLTGQHGDDQAETLLLQLLRGSGLAGLAGMPAWTALAPGFLMRPLLQHSRQDLLAYAREQGLRWIEDPSNALTTFDRNFIRREVLPLLHTRWPAACRTLARSAGHCAEALQQLDALATDLYRTTLNSDGRSLNVARIARLTPADQRLVLRHWLGAAGLRMPSLAVMERILNEVLPADVDRMPIVAWSEGEVRRYRDSLFLLPPASAFDANVRVAWSSGTVLTLPDGNGELRIIAPQPGRSLGARHWAHGPVEIRYRQGGERCRLVGRAGSHTLKNLFQEAGIPPWLRDRAPLVFIADELAAIADWWVAAPADGPDFSLCWQREGPI